MFYPWAHGKGKTDLFYVMVNLAKACPIVRYTCKEAVCDLEEEVKQLWRHLVINLNVIRFIRFI